MRFIFLTSSLFFMVLAHAQDSSKTLTVPGIMRDPKWIGTSPSSPQWSADGQTLFFSWNPEGALGDSLYRVSLTNKKPVKVSIDERKNFVPAGSAVYNSDRSAYCFARAGDIFLVDVKSGSVRTVTRTTEQETNPGFSFNNTCVVYNRTQNLFSWNISTGETRQLTNFRTGEAASTAPAGGRSARPTEGTATTSATNSQETWLKNDQLDQFEVLQLRKKKREEAERIAKELLPKEPRSIPLDGQFLQGLSIDPSGSQVTYILTRQATGNKSTIIPNFVTETGFTTDITGRPKVGTTSGQAALYFYDLEKDTVYTVKTDSLPGIRDLPAYLGDYPDRAAELKKKNAARQVSFSAPVWNQDGSRALIDIRSADNKDRWLVCWSRAAGTLRLVQRQHDEAWVGGPGIFGNTGWLNPNTCWFQSEQTGYSHLYTHHFPDSSTRALTSGSYEISQVRVSADRKSFYFISNEVFPGEQHYYKLDIASGKKTRLTFQPGGHQVSLSPDEKTMAFLYSNSTNPWEIFLQPVTAKSTGAPAPKPEQITHLARSAEFSAYPWRTGEVIQIPASDGQPIYARIYKPANPKPGMPAVFFVHGAGYLQNAHRWWSSYFREFMFNNLLADNGYYVLDIDYRGSAGYGRDWRTGIYRFMGGKDLSDHVDAARYLVQNFQVDSNRIGLYGGSYGGFITLMGLFTEPGVFSAGAALRPVTDWAQYNHPYTANILNTPAEDSIAYRRSSPLYHAAGLKGHLLICHGMVDVNVHYQDAVKLSQRLIELGKDNWELASYPMEDHGFIEPSSWTDEYKRIFRLFERVLKQGF